MNNIMNLVRFQYFSAYAIRKYILFIVAMGLIMAIANPSMIVFSCAFLLMGLTYSTAFYEEKSKVSYLVYTLPVKPTDYVISKYAYGYLNTIIAIIFSAIVYVAFSTLKNSPLEGLTLGTMALSVLAIGLVLTLIVLPLSIILGFEKGRIVIMLSAIFPLCFSTELITILSKINITISPIFIALITILTIITLTLISYFITLNIYVKKDIS